MKKYTKREVNVTYTNVENVEVRTYPCLKFGTYNGTSLTPAQMEDLRYRRIHLVVWKDDTKMSGVKYQVKLITKKGQWGSDVVENIIKDVIKKEGEFHPEDKTRQKEMMNQVWNKVKTYNDEMMGLGKPKMMRDPKTGKFMKATA